MNIPNPVSWAAQAFNSLYEAVKPSQYHAPIPDLNFDHDELLDLADIEQLRSLGREVYGNFAPVSGAILASMLTSA